MPVYSSKDAHGQELLYRISHSQTGKGGAAASAAGGELFVAHEQLRMTGYEHLQILVSSERVLISSRRVDMAPSADQPAATSSSSSKVVLQIHHRDLLYARPVAVKEDASGSSGQQALSAERLMDQGGIEETRHFIEFVMRDAGDDVAVAAALAYEGEDERRDLLPRQQQQQSRHCPQVYCNTITG